jgi:hypothetical protein
VQLFWRSPPAKQFSDESRDSLGKAQIVLQQQVLHNKAYGSGWLKEQGRQLNAYRLSRLRQKKVNTNEVYHYAKICRVTNVIRPYMETL